MNQSYAPRHRTSGWTLFVCTLISLTCTSGIRADELKTFEELNSYLQPEPYIDLGSDGKLDQIPPQTPERVALGRQVYASHCAACHGKNLEGQKDWNKPLPSGLWPAPPHDRTGHTWHHADDQLFEYVKYGPAVTLNMPELQSAMPAFKDVLNDNQILAVLVYIRSSWPERERKLQAATNDDRSGR